MNQYIRTMLAALLLVAVVSSCTQEPISAGAEEGQPVKILLSAFAPATRGLLDGTEGDPDYALTSLRVMIFRTGASLAYNFTIDLEHGDPYLLEMATGTYDFVFIANEDSDTEIRTGGKTLTQILGGYTGQTIASVYNEYFSSSAFRNDYSIPMTCIHRGVRVDGDYTVTLAGGGSPQPSPWEVAVEHAGIRVDLTLKTDQAATAAAFDGLKIANAPNKVYLFATGSDGSTPKYNVTGAGSFESASPVPAFRTFAQNSGDDYTGDDTDGYGNSIVVFADGGNSFAADPANPGTYVWHKRLILPSSTFNPASTESNAIVLQAIVGGNLCTGTLGTDALGYAAGRNNRYRLTGTLTIAKPIDFTVEKVTDWGNNDKVLVFSNDPTYFVIDHTYNGTDIHLHMAKYSQPYNYSWYVYANVPDGYNTDDVPPAGPQVSPPRENSCASLYPRDPANPWRLPTQDELIVIYDYIWKYGGESKYNFDPRINDDMYWTSITSSINTYPGCDYAYSVQMLKSNGTANVPVAKTGKIDEAWGENKYVNARCVRNGTGPGVTPPALSADVAALTALGSVETITVASNVRWKASIKPETNKVAFSADVSLVGQPLITAFNGGALAQEVYGGTAGTPTSIPLTVTTADYSSYSNVMGTLTLVFYDADSGLLLKEINIKIKV